MMNRRSLITGFAALLAMPAIVKAENLMPVQLVNYVPDAPKVPILYADGKSDDLPAIEAVLNGKPVLFKGELKFFHYTNATIQMPINKVAIPTRVYTLE